MYKSVSVPYNSKPRTAITRVARIPLAALDNNQQESISAPPIMELPEDGISMRHIPEPEGDMTLDELL
jgi:hypothetical protein